MKFIESAYFKVWAHCMLRIAVRPISRIDFIILAAMHHLVMPMVQPLPAIEAYSSMRVQQIFYVGYELRNSPLSIPIKTYTALVKKQI